MNKRSSATLAFGLTLAAVLASASDSEAYNVRYPAISCAGNFPSYGTVTSDGDSGITLSAPTSGTLWGFANCPFNNDITNADSYNDLSIANINVDLHERTGPSVAAGDVEAEACVYSGWAITCGSFSSAGAIASGGHATLAISDLSAWQDDTGEGYPFVYIETSNDTVVSIAGVYYH